MSSFAEGTEPQCGFLILGASSLAVVSVTAILLAIGVSESTLEAKMIVLSVPWFVSLYFLCRWIRKTDVRVVDGRAGHLIHKLKAKDSTGRWAYYFVLVDPHREKEFSRAITGDGMLDLEQYGKIVASCYDEKPNEEVERFLREKYGFEM